MTNWLRYNPAERFVQGSLFGDTFSSDFVSRAPIQNMGAQASSRRINTRQMQNLTNYRAALRQQEMTRDFFARPGGIQSTLMDSRVAGRLTGAGYSTSFGAPIRTYSEGAFTNLRTGRLQGSILSTQGNLFGVNSGFSVDPRTLEYGRPLQISAQGIAGNAGTQLDYARQIAGFEGRIGTNRWNLESGVVPRVQGGFTAARGAGISAGRVNLNTTSTWDARLTDLFSRRVSPQLMATREAIRAETAFARMSSFGQFASRAETAMTGVPFGASGFERLQGFSRAGFRGLGILAQGAYVYDVMNSRSSADVDAIATGQAIGMGLLGVGGFASSTGSAGARLLGAARGAVSAPAFALFSGLSAANSLGQTIGADPYRAARMRESAINDAAIFGGSMGALFGGFVGAGIGTAIGYGAGFLGSGSLNRQGFQASLQSAMRLDAQTQSERDALYSRLNFGANNQNLGQLLSRREEAYYNALQKSTGAVSTWIDSWSMNVQLVNLPRQLAGTPGPQDLESRWNTLRSAARGGTGLFEGVDYGTRAQTLIAELGTRPDIPGTRGYLDAVYGRRGGMATAYSDIDRTLRDALSSDMSALGTIPYALRNTLENIGEYQINRGISLGAGQRVIESARAIQQMQTQLSTPLIGDFPSYWNQPIVSSQAGVAPQYASGIMRLAAPQNPIARMVAPMQSPINMAPAQVQRYSSSMMRLAPPRNPIGRMVAPMQSPINMAPMATASPRQAPLDAQIVQGLQSAVRGGFGLARSGLNAVTGSIRNFLGQGAINERRGQQEIDNQERITREVMASRSLAGVAASNPQLAAALASGRNVTPGMLAGGGHGGASDYQRMMMARFAQQDARQQMMEHRNELRSEAGYLRSWAGNAVSDLAPEFERVRFDEGRVRSQATYVSGQSRLTDYMSQFTQAYDQELGRAGEVYSRNQQALIEFQGAAGEVGRQANAGFSRLAAAAGGDSVARNDVLRQQLDATRQLTQVMRTVARSASREGAAFLEYSDPVRRQQELSQAAQSTTFYDIQASTAASRAIDSQRRMEGRQFYQDQIYSLQSQQRLGLVSSQRAFRQEQGLRLDSATLDYEERTSQIERQREELDNRRASLEARIPGGASYLGSGSFLNLSEDGFQITGDARTRLEASIAREDASLTRRSTASESQWQNAQRSYGVEATRRGLTQIYAQQLTGAITPYVNALMGQARGGGSAMGGIATAFNNMVAGQYASSLGQVGGQLISRMAGDFTPTGTGPQATLETIAHILNRGGSGRSPFTAGQLNQAFAGMAVGQMAGGMIYNRINPNYNQGAGSVGSMALGAAGGILGQQLGGDRWGALGAAAGSLIGGAAGLTGTSVAAGVASGALTGALGGAALGAKLGSAVPVLGTAIGAVGGALLGGLSGLFGGRAARERAEMARQERIQYGRNLARSSFGAGTAWASDLFDGEGSFSQDMTNLQRYIGSRGNTLANEYGLIGQVRNEFLQQFRRQARFFNPIIDLANQNRAIFERPGGAQGAMFDITMRENLRVANAGQAGAPLGQLTNTFQGIRSNLAQYGFDGNRSALASDLFAAEYRNISDDLNDRMRVGQRDYDFMMRGNAINASNRQIQLDQIDRNVLNFDRDSQRQIESVMGTLQRRSNRSAIVAELQEEQDFNRDILTRQQTNARAADTLQLEQDRASSRDYIREMDRLQDSSRLLDEGFSDMSARLTNATDEFYVLSNLLKQVNREMELLARNLR